MQTSIFNREPRPCILARLACINCGPVRMALAPQEEPITTLECPYCFEAAKAERLGIGLTVRDLPYFESEGRLRQHLDALSTLPPRKQQYLRPGQVVIYCQEENILHLAHIGDIHTSRHNLSPQGVPSISFVICGEATAPVPHISAAPDCPPWWCLQAEFREMNALRNPPPMVPSKRNRKKIVSATT